MRNGPAQIGLSESQSDSVVGATGRLRMAGTSLIHSSNRDRSIKQLARGNRERLRDRTYATMRPSVRRGRVHSLVSGPCLSLLPAPLPPAHIPAGHQELQLVRRAYTAPSR